MKGMDYKNNRDEKINRLSTVCDPFLDEDIGILDSKGQIKEEGFINLIDDEKCEIRFGSINHGEKILLFSLIGFLLGFCFFINNVINTWKVNEYFHLMTVSILKEKYGENFYMNPKVPDDDKIYAYIADAQSISWSQYFYIRYMDNGFYEKSRVRENLLLDGGFFLFFVTMILTHVWLFYLFYKVSPFVIDREKQLFYTWRKGIMYVARYSQVDVVNIHNIMYLRVYGFDKKNKLRIYSFAPRIPNLIDDVISKKYLLAFMAKYLIQGKESVSSVDFKRQSSIFTLCKNSKPTDWEQQISAILAELDRLGPPRKATDPK
ncbi:hypothetical protein J8V57_11335 [Xenorhabdus sp. PB61.4]|uniref:hypothetical protein n=1 Tax=Xenorhabdus sp. PB61.4 TaxID=2788940 RepID=UPI001E5E1CD4|nr:hypothetical protein [Xenorhabdus sp. PB61.4]MCC8366871.1 hypothetical protein [Xenorhabdus sp. PB61.4]